MLLEQASKLETVIMDASKKGAAKMTDEERAALIKKLDDEMKDYLANLEAKAKANPPSYKEGWQEDNWEEEMESHPFFASNEKLLETSAKGELSPLMQGLQQLKYSSEENSPDELAKNYKEDGNFQFKLKKYRLAIAAYTEGIKCKCQDEVIQVQLVTNRAAAQYHLGNYRSSFNDCILACKIKADHLKAVKRGALCCFQLKRFADCIEWSEKALKLSTEDDKEVATILEESKVQLKESERNARREAARKKKKCKEDAVLVTALKSSKVQLKEIANLDKIDTDNQDHLDQVIEKITPVLHAAHAHRVHLNPENNILVWPVLFMYPEYGETDLIEEFEENGQTFADHLLAMFGHGIERPIWDISNKYHPDRLKVYFEDRLTNPDKVALIPLKDTNCTLKEALSDPRFQVINGLPTFIILVEQSHYETFMIKSYENPRLKS